MGTVLLRKPEEHKVQWGEGQKKKGVHPEDPEKGGPTKPGGKRRAKFRLAGGVTTFLVQKGDKGEILQKAFQKNWKEGGKTRKNRRKFREKPGGNKKSAHWG